MVLAERREESLDRGLERLAETLTECWNLPVRAVTECVLQRLQPETPIRDDVAIITMRTPVASPTMYTDVLHADKDALAGMRAQLREWLNSLGWTREARDDVILAVSEAATNAIEHGSAGDVDEIISLEGAVNDGRLLLAVSDNGSWQPNALDGFRSGRGNGHRLMEALTDDVAVSTDRLGTMVTLSRQAPLRATP